MQILLQILLMVAIIFFGWFTYRQMQKSRHLHKLLALYFNKLNSLAFNEQAKAITDLQNVGITGIKGSDHYIFERMFYILMAIGFFIIAGVIAVFGLLGVGDIQEYTRLTIIIILCFGGYKFYEYYKVAKLNYEIAVIKKIK